jgi:NADH:ubiquinone oxidoreductase subunit 6 (subunit J)
MDVIYTIFFLIFAISIVTSALGVILFKKLVHSMVSLIVCFLSVAGIYVLLNADFVAISQIMIYAVGITIIMIFAIMLTGKESEKKLWISISPQNIFAVLIGISFLILILFAVHGGIDSNINEIFNTKLPEPEIVESLKQNGTSIIIGKQLFTNYLLPFELLSVLLLAAMIGTVVLTRKDLDRIFNPTTEPSVDNATEERG